MKYKILVVEDDTVIQTELGKPFEELGNGYPLYRH